MTERELIKLPFLLLSRNAAVVTLHLPGNVTIHSPSEPL